MSNSYRFNTRAIHSGQRFGSCPYHRRSSASYSTSPLRPPSSDGLSVTWRSSLSGVVAPWNGDGWTIAISAAQARRLVLALQGLADPPRRPLSDEDFRELEARLKARAVEVMRRLDRGAGVDQTGSLARTTR